LGNTSGKVKFKTKPDYFWKKRKKKKS
jgi:hypothetical protein